MKNEKSKNLKIVELFKVFRLWICFFPVPVLYEKLFLLKKSSRKNAEWIKEENEQ